MSNHETREAWLAAAVRILTNDFEALGHKVPTVRVAVGWPHGGSKNTIGQCFPGVLAEDGIGQIFVSPMVGDAVRVLDILAHELVHAINHAAGDNGHGKAFAAIAKPFGLTGKMTATVAGDDLKARLENIANALGHFPHSALMTSKFSVNGPLNPLDPKEGGETTPTRSGKRITLVCDEHSDYKVFISKTNLETWGAPACPICTETMTVGA